MLSRSTGIAERTGGFACRYFGSHLDSDTVRCGKPSDEQVRSIASHGCAFWQREPGADFEPVRLLRIDSPPAP